MEYEKIKQLIEDMGNSNLSSIDIEFPDGIKISMKKELSNKKVEKIDKSVFEDDMIVKEEIIKEGNIIKSPMVGTCYLKSEPKAKKYVELGDKINKGDVICIIESMKLMNEIESEFDGKIVEIYIEDGEIVEYGKPLFKII